MIQYSFSTVFMAFFSSNLIIIFTAICFCNRDLLVSFGYRMFALVLGIALLRFVFPFQFSFTINVVLPKILSQIVVFLRTPFYTVGSFYISVWRIFELVWIIGILVKLIIFIVKQLVFDHQVVWQSINLTNNERYSRLLDEICGDGPNPFCVFALQNLQVPVLYGIRHPRILIPTGMELPETELRYLLSHETAHHYHHDILVKLGLNILTIVYWWNPACYVLREQLDAVLEMRIDNNVTGNDYDSQRGYLNCLVCVVEAGIERAEKGIKVPDNSIALFNLKNYNTLTNRFEVMSGKPKPYAKLLHVAALTVTVALYLLSYTFIFEARYYKEDVETIEMSVSNIYAVLNENDAYDVYYGDTLLESVDSLENYPEGTPVYQNYEEVPEELQLPLYY